MIRRFRSVQDFFISTDYADCVNDDVLTGLAAQGATKFYLVAYKDRPSSIALNAELATKGYWYSASATDKTTASKEARHHNDVEMEIETTQRTLQVIPPELEIGLAVEGDRTLYKYAFVDGNPRTVTVELKFHDLKDHSPMNPCYRTAKRRPGRLYHDVLIITFT
ncbi:hypothetical protein AAVH_14308 [Aphelenchoides avenae]|nr:hypothetical protein AAVH_14308 [Aphelenchus avenae]